MRSRYPATPSPPTQVTHPAAVGMRRADHATNEGVTAQEYCIQVGVIWLSGTTRIPHLTPPRKERMVAP